MNQKELLEELGRISKEKLDIAYRKNSDYAGKGVNDDAFKNFRLVEQLGITTTEKGMLVRMSDKLSRLATLTDGKAAKVKDESIFDTLKDLANYSDLLQCYLIDKRGPKLNKSPSPETIKFNISESHDCDDCEGGPIEMQPNDLLVPGHLLHVAIGELGGLCNVEIIELDNGSYHVIKKPKLRPTPDPGPGEVIERLF